MLRCFENDNITHVDGSIDPVRDKGIIDTELQLKDLETIENRLAKTQKQAVVGGDKQAKRAVEILLQYKAVLEQGLSARTVELEKEDRKLVADLNLLTDKPVLYVCNVDEKSAVTGNEHTRAVEAAIADERAEMLIVAAATEADIAELDEYEERQMFLEEIGLKESGVARLIKAAYKLLDLQTFFTTGADESRAWTFRRGMKRPRPPASSTPISSGASSVPKSSSTTTMWRWVPKRPAATRARSGLRVRSTWCRTATSCTSCSTCSAALPFTVAGGAPPDAVIVSC